MLEIRLAQAQDVDDILCLIKELALYEKNLGAVTNTSEQMLQDGFGKNPIFKTFLAIMDQKIIGMALFYTRYSTWKGRILYLEDIIVKETYRNQGIGKQLMQNVIQYAQENTFNGITWQVLDWNIPAINFYQKYPITIDKEWWNIKIDFT